MNFQTELANLNKKHEMIINSHKQLYGNFIITSNEDAIVEEPPDDVKVKEFWPYPDNREIWIDGKFIARNEKLVANYLDYLPAPLYKNPCFPYMTGEEQDNYNYQLDRITYANVYKHI